ncbi:hypothetical protein H9Y04_20705 [Streptomyces sp. TRM66268-LWL]|uniref:Uncharacterized protein n=1 Tax=Streptomyces polyasparticus TaxID=2767826 RepID=A0ABR7SJ38_9ACTN|nr:hypothetical protein [Streptomyces polyasparticus]MBC9714974.1 hypothetical protein [Streptomyces polyasparticus]
MRRHRLLVAFALPAVLLFVGCADNEPASPGTALGAERTGPAPSTYPADQETLPPRTGDDNAPVQGPERPKAGTWYPHDLFSHCGVESTRFAGKTWILRTVRTDLTSPVPLDEDSGRHNTFNYMAGYIQLQDPGMAVFVSAHLPPLEFVPGTSNRACD